ncbi:hypothetical protein DVH05_003556 [Phytophthora capsici]|nr:hypothetical protein DVH05_003556 [Phytophthora capsici]
MGTSPSKTSPLAPTFERMATWDLKASRGLLQTYKEKDMDFGLDSQGLAELLGGDKDWAENIVDAFRSTSGIINALAFISGACLVSSGSALDKAEMIFDGLDFDGTEQISMDEMTIAFLCCARGFCVMSGVGTVPSDEELESVTLQAYRDLNKGPTQSITKAEFTQWVLEFASGTGAPITREVTLENVVEQFRVVPKDDEKDDEKDDNKLFSPPLETYKAHKADQPESHDDGLASDPTESTSQVEHPEPLEPELAEMSYDKEEEAGQDEAPSGYRSDEGVSYEPAIETVDLCGVSADAESDYPTFVADTEEDQSTKVREDYSAPKPEIVAPGEVLSELENDDTLYEQDDFPQETPRVDSEADANVSLPGDHSKDNQPTNSTIVSVPATVDAIDVLETKGDTEEIAAQDVDNDVEANEPSALTPNTAIEKDSTSAITDSAGDPPRTDLDIFGRLPSPESHDNNAAVLDDPTKDTPVE